MDNDSIKFQYYEGNIRKCKPKGFITLPQYIESTRAPKHPEIFPQIAKAKEDGDIALKAQLKETLFGFTPAAIFDGWRKGIYITSFIGIAPTDWDGMTTADAIEFKHYLFNHYPCFYSVHLSSSWHGVRGFIKIPSVRTITEFKQYFRAITAEFSQYEFHFDTQLQTPVQLIFQGYDPDILFRYDPETWTDKIAAPEPPAVNMNTPVIGTVSDREIQFIREVCLKGLQTSYKAITDTGHPNVLSITRRAGGFAGAGYFTQHEMIDLLYSMIEGHTYLKQKAETYKATAAWAINEVNKSRGSD